MTTETPISPELRTWARDILEQYRAVEALHTPQVRWIIPGLDETSFASEEEAVEWDPDTVKAEDLQTFVVCQECARIERESLSEQAGGEWGYLSSQWPCRTATALGKS